jgi:hypothetical protein
MTLTWPLFPPSSIAEIHIQFPVRARMEVSREEIGVCEIPSSGPHWIDLRRAAPRTPMVFDAPEW